MTRITVDSRIRVSARDLPQAVLDELRFEFEHSNPAHHKLKRRRLSTAGEPPILRTWREDSPGEVSFPRGGMARVERILRRAKLHYSVVDAREGGSPLPEEFTHSPSGDPDAPGDLWDFQRRLFDAAMRHETALFRSPTASGKSTTAIAIIASLGVPALIVVHNAGLRKQWVRRIERELGIPARKVGVIGGGKHRLAPVTIAMHQSLALDGGVTEEMRAYFGVVVVDEVQRAAARTMYAAVDPFPARYRIGVSDSERRKDGKQFLVYDLFGPVAEEVTREEVEATGNVLDVEIRAVPTNYRAPWYERTMMNLEKMHSGAANQADHRLLQEMSESAERNAMVMAILEHEVARGEQCLVLSRRVEHCRAIDRMLVQRGVRTGYLVGDNPAQYEETIAALSDRSCSVGVGTIEAVGTGIDLPYVGVGVTTHPVAGNEGLTSQLRGRLARAPKGKTRAVLYVLWDRHVHGLGHLRTLVKRNRTVSVLTDRGLVSGLAALDGATLSLSLRGITECLSNADNSKLIEESTPRRMTKMRSRKPAITTPSDNTQAAGGASANALAQDGSALAIALKEAGHKVPVSNVESWNDVQRFAAAAYAQGKTEDVPAHVALFGPEGLLPSEQRQTSLPGSGGDTRVSPPPLVTADEVDRLCAGLESKGIAVKLLQVGEWTPRQRQQTAAWLNGEGDKPAFLAGSEGYKPEPKAPRRASHAQPPPSDALGLSVPEMVSVTWGEEKFTVVPGTFSTCAVGPFSRTGPILEGESYADAHARLYAEVEAVALKERDRKMTRYRDVLESSGITAGGKKVTS